MVHVPYYTGTCTNTCCTHSDSVLYILLVHVPVHCIGSTCACTRTSTCTWMYDSNYMYRDVHSIHMQVYYTCNRYLYLLDPLASTAVGSSKCTCPIVHVQGTQCWLNSNHTNGTTANSPRRLTPQSTRRNAAHRDYAYILLDLLLIVRSIDLHVDVALGLLHVHSIHGDLGSSWYY